MTERRYGDDEVRKILEAAARDDADTPGEGLTLREIQGIAREAGLSAAAVTGAAASLDATAAARRTSLGAPVEVARVVPLPRAPTDEEWERLVAELRGTFRARGRVAVHGSLREWSNGRLHACVEPAAYGYRLRMGTLKSGAEQTNTLGVAGIAAGAVLAGVTAVGGAPELAGPLMLGITGAAAVVANMIRLPRWARVREQQMARIDATVRAMLDPAGRLVEPVAGGDAADRA